jgi:hypothetical protein
MAFIVFSIDLIIRWLFCVFFINNLTACLLFRVSYGSEIHTATVPLFGEGWRNLMKYLIVIEWLQRIRFEDGSLESW